MSISGRGAMEIERKFLVEGEGPVLPGAPSSPIRQGYLVVGTNGEARVRERGAVHTLTVKTGHGLERAEYEVELTRDQFDVLWPATSGMRVEKVRYRIETGELTYELDVYSGALEGLRTVEVEFGAVEQARAFTPPSWFGRDVTGVPGYSNAELALQGTPARPGSAFTVAAIDIGTNSVRCTITEFSPGNPRKTLNDQKAYTRLGRGLDSTNKLSDSAVEDTIDALRGMLEQVAQHQATHVRAVATAAVRQAANREEFVSRVREELGLEIEVIAEEEEGRLAFLSAAEVAPLEGRSGVLDMGGGSLEVVLATDGRIESIASMPLGAVVMSERYHTHDPMSEADHVHLGRRVRRTLKRSLGENMDSVDTLVGSGGTVTAIAALVAVDRTPGLSDFQGYSVSRAEVKRLRAALALTTAKQRAAMKGMRPSRVDIIVAGVVVVHEAMRRLGADRIIVNTRGIRQGILIDLIERERPR